MTPSSSSSANTSSGGISSALQQYLASQALGGTNTSTSSPNFAQVASQAPAAQQSNIANAAASQGAPLAAALSGSGQTGAAGLMAQISPYLAAAQVLNQATQNAAPKWAGGGGFST